MGLNKKDRFKKGEIEIRETSWEAFGNLLKAWNYEEKERDGYDFMSP